MKIIVTGAAGLYGVHLVDALLRKNNVKRVYGVDDFSRDFIEDPFSFLESHPDKEKFELFNLDFKEINTVMIDKLDIDIVVHLAAHVSIPESMDNAFPYFHNNEYGTFKLLQTLWKTKKQPFFLYASSPEVYGNPIVTPIDIDHPFNPRSVYATTKLAAEKHCLAMNQWYDYPTTIIRNFNTFGPNQNTFKYAAVIPNFIVKALKNEDLIVDNDGSQTRDFMYIADAVRAYELAIENRESISGKVFNIGTGKETTIKELAEKIIKLTGSQSRIVYKKGRNADLYKLQADTSKTQEALGWAIEWGLDEGLNETIEWFKKKLVETDNQTAENLQVIP